MRITLGLFSFLFLKQACKCHHIIQGGSIIMATHDRYEIDILKALQRIAGSLDRIEKKMSDRQECNKEKCLIGEPMLEQSRKR